MELLQSRDSYLGGFYVWDSVESMERFAQSDLFRGFALDPRIVNIQAQTFGVLDQPSRMTNGLRLAPL